MCFLTRVCIEQQVPVAQPPAGVGGGLPAQQAADLSKEGTPPPRKPCQRPRGLTGSTEP